jgi:enamine deaminase RidA (YjgF/YER057c/UK114 family)
MGIERYTVNDYGGGVVHTPVVKAGHWVFATGLRATDASGRMDAAVVKAGRPLDPPPRAGREAAFIFRGLAEALGAAGSGLANVVRVDQYYPDWRSVDPYHRQRKAALGAVSPPSTSVLVQRLQVPDARMDVQAIAATSASGFVARPVLVPGVGAPSGSGYSPCTRVGDLVFVAGQLARDASDNIPAEARVQEGQLWKGTRIVLETNYLIERRLKPALEAAGSGMDLILKAQVYLSHAEDLPAFWETWAAQFAGKAPPTLLVPLQHPAFGTRDATVEINVVAAAASARARMKDIDCGTALVAPGMLAARSFDGLLFVAGLMALDGEGLVPAARSNPSVRAQMADILGKAEQVFAAAGSDLRHVLRVLQFHVDVGDFAESWSAWEPALRGAGLPFSAVETGVEPFVPGARLVADFWGAVP